MIPQGIQQLHHALEAQVQVWLLPLPQGDRLEEGLTAFLSADEQAHLRKLSRPEVQIRFAATRHVLRVLLGDQLGESPERLRLQTNSFGKPSLADDHPGLSLWFNVTHSHTVALLAISRQGEVGVDVEPLRPMPDALKLAERFFCPAEHQMLKGLEEAFQSEAFLRMWTAKEAFVKAIGEGLAHPIHEVEIALGGPDGLVVQGIHPRAGKPGGMAFAALESLSGHASMLVLLQGQNEPLSAAR